MTSNQRKRGDSMISNPECTFLDRWRTAASSRAINLVRNPPIDNQSLEAVLGELAPQTPIADREDSFDGFLNRLVSEKRPTSSIWPAQYR